MLKRLVTSSLPALPGGVTLTLEGEHLDHSTLRLTPGVRSAEDAVTQFRQRHSAESLPFFRRYYLEPVIRGGVATGEHVLHYVWNTKRKRTDRTVGTFRGNDLTAAKILIGNQVANCALTPVRWILCEDRAGEEVIEAGRFDPWSLLRGVSDASLEKAAAQDIAPKFEGWDFDQMYHGRDCPGCGNWVSINILAFNVDSARCATCGIRPHLSRLLGSSLQMALPSVTGEGELVITADQALLSAVEYMGHLGSSVSDLHKEALPGQWTPKLVLEGLLGHSRLITKGEDGGTTIVPAVLSKLQLAGSADLAKHAAASLASAVRNGGPFTSTHGAIANLLKEILKEA